MRARKPWVRLRRNVLGWNVRFMAWSSDWALVKAKPNTIKRVYQSVKVFRLCTRRNRLWITCDGHDRLRQRLHHAVYTPKLLTARFRPSESY